MSTFKIHLHGTSDTKQWIAAEGVLKSLESEANKFIETLKMGVGIDLGGRLVSTLASLPNVFTDALREGVKFNTELHDSEIAIGNVLQKFQGLSSEAAKEQASKAIAKIVELEPQVAGTLGDLTAGLLATVAKAQSAGIAIEQNIELVGMFANALANANIPAEQLGQEMRAIFTGNITPDAALAGVLGITNADVKAAVEAGKLYEMLKEKIGTLGVAGDSAAVAFSTLDSSLKKVQGILAKPLFDLLIQGAKDLSEALADPAIQKSLADVGVKVGEVARGGLQLTAWALQNAPALLRVAEAAAKAGSAFAAFKLAQLIAGLTSMAVRWLTVSAAVTTNTTALAANTAAAQANASAGAALPAAMAVTGARAGGALGSSLMTAFGRIFTVVAIMKIVNDVFTAVEIDMERRRIQRGTRDIESDPKNSGVDVAAKLIGNANTDEAKAEAKRFLAIVIRDLNAELENTTDPNLRANVQMKLNVAENFLRDFDQLAGKLAGPATVAGETAKPKSAKEREQELKDQIRSLEEGATTAAQKQTVEWARRLFDAEMAINQARVSGNEELAKQFEDQKAILELAKHIRETQDKSFEQAMSDARQMVGLERAISEAANKTKEAKEASARMTSEDALIAAAQRSRSAARRDPEKEFQDFFSPGRTMDAPRASSGFNNFFRRTSATPAADASPASIYPVSPIGAPPVATPNAGQPNASGDIILGGKNASAEEARAAADQMRSATRAIARRDAETAAELKNLKAEIKRLENQLENTQRQTATNRN